MVAYERWLESRSPELLDEIERYNADDCLSTLKLRDWLESLRPEWERRFGVLLSRPDVRSGEAAAEQEEHERETAGLASRLLVGVPEMAAKRDADAQARWLLAQSLSFHRREQ